MNLERQHGAARRRMRIILVIVCAGMALFQVGVAVHAFDLPASLSLIPGLELAGAGFWTAVFAVSAYRLLRDRRGSRRAAGWLLIGFVAYSAARLTVFVRADYDRGRLPFVWLAAMGMTVLLCWIDLRPAVLRRMRRARQTEKTL